MRQLDNNNHASKQHRYQHIKNTITGGNLTSNGGQLGMSVPLGAGSVMASFAYTKNSGMNDTSRSTWALGYDYDLSKRTDLYAAYLNDKVSGLEAGNTFGVGMRTKF
ncbi:porin [Pandoraea horticolens]|uniref:Porin n=1 Tax=Pandoraea horticolens TaxID=2508298 RepID=A0A5E4XXS5_9BURK|nr:porin [Pandoraea horticolens]